MAFVSITATIHLGPLDANANIFTAAVPAEHPGRLVYAEIDEAFDIGRPQLPPRQANATVEFRDNRADYEARRLQSDYLLIIRDSEDGGTPVERFRGRIRKPRVSDAEHGRINVRVSAWGLWQRLRRSQDVAVPEIQDANGKQAVDAILDQVNWPTSYRNVPSLPSGADIEYAEWAYAGPPADGIAQALAGINPRSKFYVDAAGVAQVVWLSADIQAFRAEMIRPDLSRDFSALHVINQVLATALDLTRTTTTRYTSTVAVDLDDDMDTVIFEGTLQGGADNTRWALNFRQPNGTYFPYHVDVDGHLTATLIPGSASSFRVVASARARSGNYTTVVNFFQIQETVTSQVASTEAPLVRNLNSVAPTEPRTFQIPVLPYPAGHAEILADNYLSLWGRPLQFASFEMVANDDVRLLALRGLRLWDRVSLFDGNDTHFGFVARKVWRYGKITDVRLTMMEDFTEGGDISIPFRLPFEWTFPNIAALDMFFERASTLNNQGAWADETSGSTPTNQTGPTGNNALAFVHTETTGGNRVDHEDNGVLALDDDVFSVIRNRDVVFRYAAYGSFAAGDGLVVQGRTVQTSLVDDVILVELQQPAPPNDIDVELWRINISDPDDETAPYGSLGALAGTDLTDRFTAAALAPNGDIIVVEGGSPTELWRINPNDVTDQTGDYGVIGNVYNAARNISGMAIDSSGDVIALVFTTLYRINLSTPSLESGIYGRIGSMPSGFPSGSAFAIDSSGNGYAVASDANADDLWRINIGNPSSTIAPYGNLGIIPNAPSNLISMGVLSNDDVVVADSQKALFRVNPNDVTDVSGDYGEIGSLPADLVRASGMTIVSREARNEGAWTDIATLPASTYPSGNLAEGDTDTDVEGDDYTVAADGGWRDFTVSIPTTYQEIRVRPNLNAGGNAARQDIALRSVRSA